MKKPKIIFRNSGIGSCISDKNRKWIELNKNLKKYPKLFKKVLKHEILHYKSKNKHIDFKIDLFDKTPKGLWKFIIKNPKALTEFLPMWFDHKGRLVPNYFLCLMYGLMFLTFLIFIIILEVL